MNMRSVFRLGMFCQNTKDICTYIFCQKFKFVSYLHYQIHVTNGWIGKAKAYWCLKLSSHFMYVMYLNITTKPSTTTIHLPNLFWHKPRIYETVFQYWDIFWKSRHWFRFHRQVQSWHSVVHFDTFSYLGGGLKTYSS